MISLLGVILLLSVAVGLSSNRSAIRLRTVSLAFALQVTIGFVAYEGTGGIFSTRFDIPEPEEGSFEDLMHRYGQPYLLVPLRPKNPFAEPMLAAPMAYGRNTLAPWPEVLDALFYIQEMTPSSR